MKSAQTIVTEQRRNRLGLDSLCEIASGKLVADLIHESPEAGKPRPTPQRLAELMEKAGGRSPRRCCSC